MSTSDISILQQVIDKSKKIVFFGGAGVSTESGIPDFRTPGTGLYDNIKKYGLSNPELLFNRNYIKQNPKPFFTLVKDFIGNNYEPSDAHYLSILFINEILHSKY